MGQSTLAETQITKIIQCLQGTLSPWLILVFGSWATGRAREDSDIDIAFLSDAKNNSYDVFMTGQALAVQLGMDVDLLDLSEASAVLKAQIVSGGRVLYCSDEARRMVFFMRTLKEYAVLNEERAPILTEIAERGSVYDYRRGL